MMKYCHSVQCVHQVTWSSRQLDDTTSKYWMPFSELKCGRSATKWHSFDTQSLFQTSQTTFSWLNNKIVSSESVNINMFMFFRSKKVQNYPKCILANFQNLENFWLACNMFQGLKGWCNVRITKSFLIWLGI